MESQDQHSQDRTQLTPDKLKILDNLRKNVIGSHLNTLLRTPFGQKPFVYCDSTASGKALKYIEEYLQTVIMPFYANTHTMQSSAGRKTMACREDARAIIKRVMGCSDQDAVVFSGSGSTSASNLLISKLKVKELADFLKLREQAAKYMSEDKLLDYLVDSYNPGLDAKQHCQREEWNSYKCTLCEIKVTGLQLFIEHTGTDAHKKQLKRMLGSEEKEVLPIVFVSVFEHNSNVLPWKEAGARVEVMPMTNNGDMDYDMIEKRLKEVQHERCLKVGAFSAGSNISGTLFDVDRLSQICHTYGALACFDYAAVSPYVNINMSGPSPHRRWDYIVDDEMCWKDAIIVSPHKLVGGPQTSGLLVAKRDVLFDTKPHRVGGGPILFVNEKKWEYVDNPEELEEAGTPAILQDIRTGIVFELKDQIGEETIHLREDLIMKKVLPRLLKVPNLILMGNNNLPKVPIFAFVIRTFNGKILHPNFVTQLLGDLFGIQTRSGCSCAGMYGLKLLGVDDGLADIYLGAIYQGLEIVKMGYSRLNFSYFFNDEDVDYICHALEFVSKYGWMFLANYEFEMKRGLWISKDEKRFETNTRIGDIDFTQDHLGIPKTNNLHLKTIHTFQEVNPLYFYIEKAYIHLMDIVEKYEYENHHNFNIKDNCQSCQIPQTWRPYIWWLFPVESLEPLLSLKSNSVEACDALNLRLNAQTTPFKLPFQISDLTRNPNLYKKVATDFKPPYATDPSEATEDFKNLLQTMADPNREFRKHLVNLTVEEKEEEDRSSARLTLMVSGRKSFVNRKQSGVNMVNVEHIPSGTDVAKVAGMYQEPKDEKTELLHMVPEAPSDNAHSHAIASESASAASDDGRSGEETKSSQFVDRRGTNMDIDVGQLDSKSGDESSISPSMRFPTTKPNNASTFYNTKYGEGKLTEESPPTIELNQNYDMKGQYQKQKTLRTPVGKGSKNLTSLISKQLAYVNEENAKYDVDNTKYGKKVLNTSPERTNPNAPKTTKQKSPSPTGKGPSTGAMFTEMRKSAYKRKPL